MTDSQISDIIWVAVTVLAITSITNNIIGFHINRIEKRISELSKMMTEHTRLLKRIGGGTE